MIFFYLLNQIFSASNIFEMNHLTSEKLQNQQSHEVIKEEEIYKWQWFEEMICLQTSIELYLIMNRGVTRINIAALALLVSVDDFTKIIQGCKDVKLIKSLKMFIKEKNTNYLRMMNDELIDLDLDCSTDVNIFILEIHKQIICATQYAIRNWQYMLTIKGSKTNTYSEEDKNFRHLLVARTVPKDEESLLYYAYVFNKDDIQKMRKKPLEIYFEGENKSKVNSKYFFIMNDPKMEEEIEQKHLNNIKRIQHGDNFYVITGIFIENKLTSSIVIMIKKNGQWSTFGDKKQEWNYVKFINPWHVTLVMCEIITNE